jgi:uncharacterized Fe-S cluster protein YjdI
MKDITKKYTNGEITIVWKPATCIHSARCWKGAEGLIEVFNPAEKPWIKPEGASTQRIIDQISKCPSGALSFYYNSETNPPEEITSDTKAEVVENGPLLVYGNLTVKRANGETETKHKVTAFCRCGQSNNKPYCDGSHVKSGFNG